MKKEIESEHFIDDDGNLTGGKTSGIGFEINWQNGLIPKGEKPNGAFVEHLILACLDRMTFYQNSKFACEQNAKTIECLQEALNSQITRTCERIDRNVEGTNEV